MAEKIEKSENEWRENLTDEQFHITRRKGTERAFSGKYYDWKEKGIYRCVCCDTPLFSSDSKYDSGSGWPSFKKPLQEQAICTERDTTHNMERVEISCNTCDAHLGHVFDDGPPPTFMRYCVNSASLTFEKLNEER